MQQILSTLGRVLRRSCLILGLTISLFSLFIFFPHTSYAGQTNMSTGSEAKLQQKVHEKTEKLTSGIEEAKKERKADRPLDVQEEQVKKGVIEEAKVVRDLLTGTKPDGTSVFDSERN